MQRPPPGLCRRPVDSVGRWPWLKSPRMSPFSAMEAIQPGGWASWALTFNPASRFPCTPSQLCELPGLVHVGGDNGKASPGPGEASVDTMLIGCIVQPCSRRASINSGSYFRYYCWIRSSREKKKKKRNSREITKPKGIGWIQVWGISEPCAFQVS